MVIKCVHQEDVAGPYYDEGLIFVFEDKQIACYTDQWEGA
jgi:hypothetical protein